MPSVSTSQYDVQYSRSGHGAPTLFVHGSFANSGAWRAIIQALDGKAIEAISLDLIGCGATSPAAGAGSLLSQDIAAVEHVAREAASGPIHLVGHSYGGIVCLGAALACNVSIASLTLFEPLPIMFLSHTGDEDAVETIRRFLRDYEAAFDAGEQWAFSRVINLWGGEGAFDALPLKVRDAMASATADNIRQWHDNLAFTSPLKAYRALTMPTTLAFGEHANPIVKTIAARLAELMPHAAAHQIDGTGHFMIHSHAAKCAKLVQDTVGI